MTEMSVEKSSQQVQNLFNKGLGAFERGNLDYAIDLLTSCVTAEPALLQARKFLRAAEMRDFKNSRKNSPMSRKMADMTGASITLKTNRLIKAGDGKQALIEAEKLLRKHPLNPSFGKLLARASVAAELPEIGLQTLEIMREIYPKDADLVDLMGQVNVKAGNTGEARECFETLNKLRPNNPAAVKALKDALAMHSMRADRWEQTADEGGTFRDVVKDTKEAALLEKESKAVKTDKDAVDLIADAISKIQEEPENINYYRSLARLYVQRKMFDEAIQTLEKAFELSKGDPEVDNALSVMRVQKINQDIEDLVEAGRNEEAEALRGERDVYVAADLEDRIRRYPNDLRLRFEWGMMLFEQGKLNEAIQQFQLSQRNPKHRAHSLYHLALCFKSKQQYDMAVEQLEEAMAEIGTMNATKKDICYELGEISVLMGDKQRAADYYKQIYQVDIGYRDIAEKIEQVYQK